jgi:tripartite-type tricarboxylate transporter receptor subunit TctC
MLKSWKGILLVVLLLGLSVGALADSAYPAKPIKLIVPYGAGGGTDTVARMIQNGLKKVLPQPVAIVNIGGGAGVVGMRELKNSKPDGYTMGFDIINLWTNKALGTSSFGPLDFEPVAQTGTYYLCMVASAKSKYKDFGDVIKAIKEKPKSFAEATNIGAIIHFNSLALQDQIGKGAEIKFVHIGDGGGRFSAVLGGHVDATITAAHQAKVFYDSGEMKVLAVYTKNRLPEMPDVPSTTEYEIKLPGEVGYWFFMPKGTPRKKVDYMANALEKVMKDPEINQSFKKLIMEPSFIKGKAFTKKIKDDGEIIMKLAETYNLKK